jgi:cobalt-precorrin-5B (C1)-methyltransferase
MKKLRTGYTTGACAAAASKGSAMMLREQRSVGSIHIDLPGEKDVFFKLHNAAFNQYNARCSVQKDAGDDPDVTSGLHIFSNVELFGKEGIIITGGDGVGRVTKPGLRSPVGEFAINPVPKKMIDQAVRQFYSGGIKVTIAVPGGEKIAKKTFNEKLGITGGISIIGTTGIVKPFSVSALKTSIIMELEVARASGIEMAFLVPGNIGKASVLAHYRIEQDSIVMVSNYIGEMLKESSKRFKNIVLAGHPGKLVKILQGDFYTHSKSSRSALPLVKRRAHALFHEIQDIEEITTVEGVVHVLAALERAVLFNKLAEEIESVVNRYLGYQSRAGVLLVDMHRNIIGKGKQISTWEADRCLRSTS